MAQYFWLFIFFNINAQALNSMDFLRNVFCKKQVLIPEKKSPIPSLSYKELQQQFLPEIWQIIVGYCDIEFQLKQIYYRIPKIDKNLAEYIVDEFYQKASSLADYQLYDVDFGINPTDKILFHKKFIQKKNSFLKKIQFAFRNCSEENKTILNQAFTEKISLTLGVKLLVSLDLNRWKNAQFYLPSESNRTLVQNIQLVTIAASRTEQGNIPTITLNDCTQHKLLSGLDADLKQSSLVDAPANSPFIELDFNIKNSLDARIRRFADTVSYHYYKMELLEKEIDKYWLNNNYNSDSDDYSS